MATTTTIYPQAAYWHERTSPTWAEARNSLVSDNVYSTNPASTGIKQDGKYFFRRTYLRFVLSSIPGGATITSITISLRRVDKVVSPYSPFIAYSGSTRIVGRPSEYPLYIDNLAEKGSPLDQIALPDDTRYYTSRGFDLEIYPISPGETLVVGIIDPGDFNNTVESISDFYQFNIDPASNQPYIEVTYDGGGYNKPVMGISNFTNLNGIPSANIVSVMGVI